MSVSVPDPGTGKPRVLMADDDATGRLLLKTALEQAGFEVTDAADGAEAIERFEKTRPDLVVLDVVMPVMDGYQACAALRARPEGKVVPILMLTGLDDLGSINRAYEVGATDFAVKPISWVLLSHRVRYMLRAARAWADLRRSEARLRSAQRIARVGSWERALDSARETWSEEVHRIVGTDPASAPAGTEDLLRFVHPEEKDALLRARAETLRTGQPYGIDLRLVLDNGAVRYAYEQGELVLDEEGRAITLAGTIQDVTERREAQEWISFLAEYDSLTHLPNRTLFSEMLASSLDRARTEGGMIATLFLDLDQFKRITDTLGHSSGDRVLQGVAERLRRLVRSPQALVDAGLPRATVTLARPGGDEFVLSVEGISRGEDAASVAERVLDLLGNSFAMDDHELYVSASLGISLFPQDGADVETLLAKAETAMHHAKEKGWGSYQFFDARMNAASAGRLSLEGSLRRAVERRELLLYYQPQIDVETGAMVAAEALVRWRHPERGLVPPLEFIPLAEETGLILPIGQWVLQTACEDLRAWREAGHSLPSVSINLSACEFRQDGLAGRISSALRSCGLGPTDLEIEITESVLMAGDSATARNLKELDALGLRLALDDFGTGYSSLAYLKRLPVRTLKIDRSFIADIVSRPDDAAITDAIMAMARSLKIETVAEGVESAEQMLILRQLGCRVMQGYRFSRPLPPADFVKLLPKRRPVLSQSAAS